MLKKILSISIFFIWTAIVKAQLIPFKDNATNLYGYKSPSGAIRVTPRYSMANPFHAGLASVNKGAVVTGVNASGGKWGFIDSTGNLVIPMIYDYVQNFHGDSAYVVKDRKKFLINKQGKIIDQTKRYTILRASDSINWNK